MKKLIKLKLNQLCNSELKKREMNTIKGGKCCVCGCRAITETQMLRTDMSLLMVWVVWEEVCNIGRVKE